MCSVQIAECRLMIMMKGAGLWVISMKSLFMIKVTGD